MTASPIQQVNGTKLAVPVLGDWQPISFDGTATVWEKSAAPVAPADVEVTEPVSAAPAVDLVAEAEAEAIRARALAEAEALRIKAEADAKAAEITAVEDARKQKIANDRAEDRRVEEQAARQARIAENAEKKAAVNAAAEKAQQDAAAETAREAERLAEQERTERIWKWGARGIYAVCLAIAAPVQFLDFWDPARKFLVAAPAMLEGIAIVLACGAAWAVAHRRDVMPYRVGIILGAAIAGTINLRGGLSNPAIGFNAGLVGAIASMVGPIILMVYEHGIAQKADGIPSGRERRAADKAKAKEAADRAKAKAEKDAAAKKVVDEKAEQLKVSEAEQERKDEDRKVNHSRVWEVADSIRSARGSAAVTDGIWSEAWLRVTGSKLVGVTPEMEALSREALARMKDATEITPGDSLSQVESLKEPRPKRDPNAPDGRRFNGGTPPRRTPGDTPSYSPIAKKQAAIEQTSTASAN